MLVLIIEDDVILVNEWRDAFEASGHTVLACNNVINGLSACISQRPDAIVLDSFFKDSFGELTGEGALTFTTRLGNHCYETGAKPPIIVGITASVPTESFPIDVFGQLPKNLVVKKLRKPISPTTLVQHVERSVNRNKETR